MRCRCCNVEFAETSGWQEFCSLHCASAWAVGRPVEELDAADRRDQKRLAAWREWLADGRNARLVRMQALPEPRPAFGVFEDRAVELADGTRRRVRVNVGSQIAVRPMTDADREAARRCEGRGFSDGHVRNPVADDVPSLHGQVGRGWFPHD